MNPQLFIGPMSKNIVDTVIEFSGHQNVPLGLCASRRQVEFNGGYVNNWTSRTFSRYVGQKAPDIMLVRDHGGPMQGLIEDDGMNSFTYDARYFDVIHIDPWKVVTTIDWGIIITAMYINFCNRYSGTCLFEIGTEQAIYAMTPKDLNLLLSGLKDLLNECLFARIKYAVIQSGTSLEETSNTGKYDRNKLKEMIEICESFGVLSKEHNGDYLQSELIKEKFSLGLNAINIAPEFGVMETLCILDRIDDEHMLNEFHSMCVESGKWKKWVDKDFDPFKDKRQLIKICGHYLFSDVRFKQMMKSDVFDGLSGDVKDVVSSRINDILF